MRLLEPNHARKACQRGWSPRAAPVTIWTSTVFPMGRQGKAADNVATVSSIAGSGTNPVMSKDLSSTKQRKKLSKKSFALPGKRKYPIPDKAHARNALARVAQHGSPAEKKKVKAAVKKRYPSLAH